MKEKRQLPQATPTPRRRTRTLKYFTHDQPEQPTLLSEEELAALTRPATSLPSTGAKARLSETREVRKARRSKGDVLQFSLPGL
jgi:hypothetical protein